MQVRVVGWLFCVWVILACAPFLEARESKAEKKEYSQALREFFFVVDHIYLKNQTTEQDWGKLTGSFEKILLKISQPKSQALRSLLASSQKSLDQLPVLRSEVLKAFEVSLAPVHTPKKDRGRYVYTKYCMSCHGVQGDGGGELAGRFSPTPLSFTDPQNRSKLSAHHIYNVLLTGTPSGSMVSMEKILKKEYLWDVAYYTLALAEGCGGEGEVQEGGREALQLFPMEKLASLSQKAWLLESHREPSWRELRCQRPFIASSLP